MRYNQWRGVEVKRILVFLGLKVLEIGIIVLPYWISRFLCRWNWWREEVLLGKIEVVPPILIYWLTGLLALTVPVGVVLVLILFIKFNWEKAGDLTS